MPSHDIESLWAMPWSPTLSLWFDLPKNFIKGIIIMEKMHDFQYVNTFIKFSSIYHWSFLLFTVGLLYKHLLWWVILCANYLCKRYYWDLIIIFIGCNLNLEQKWVFHTSPIAFGPYSKPKVESQSWLPENHMGNPKTPALTFCNLLEVWTLEPLACNAWGLNLTFKTCCN